MGSVQMAGDQSPRRLRNRRFSGGGDRRPACHVRAGQTDGPVHGDRHGARHRTPERPDRAALGSSRGPPRSCGQAHPGDRQGHPRAGGEGRGRHEPVGAVSLDPTGPRMGRPGGRQGGAGQAHRDEGASQGRLAGHGPAVFDPRRIPAARHKLSGRDLFRRHVRRAIEGCRLARPEVFGLQPRREAEGGDARRRDVHRLRRPRHRPQRAEGLRPAPAGTFRRRSSRHLLAAGHLEHRRRQRLGRSGGLRAGGRAGEAHRSGRGGLGQDPVRRHGHGLQLAFGRSGGDCDAAGAGRLLPEARQAPRTPQDLSGPDERSLPRRSLPGAGQLLQARGTGRDRRGV